MELDDIMVRIGEAVTLDYAGERPTARALLEALWEEIKTVMQEWMWNCRRFRMGEAPLRMGSRLSGPDWFFQYRLIDIRTLDGERLLESGDVGDNAIAILARLRDHKVAVHRIAGLAAAERETALAQLTILAGLRHLARTVERETRMPIDLDIRDHETLGPMIREAEVKSRHEGDLTILRRQIARRFGALPGWAAEKLAGFSPAELEELSERVLDAGSVEELLR